MMIERLNEMLFNWMTLFYSIAAIVLYFIRRMARLQGDNFASALIDTGITFTAGGHLRMHHKLERWFFGILLIGSFFFCALWLEMILLPSFLLPDRKVDTFDKMAQINPPIYLFPMLKKSNHLIDDMLRFDF